MANSPSEQAQEPKDVRGRMLDETHVQVDFIPYPGEHIVFGTDWSWQEKRKYHLITTEDASVQQLLKWATGWKITDVNGEPLSQPSYYIDHMDELNIHVRKLSLLLRSVYVAFNCASELP